MSAFRHTAKWSFFIKSAPTQASNAREGRTRPRSKLTRSTICSPNIAYWIVPSNSVGRRAPKRNPGARHHPISEAGAHSVTLILRNRKATAVGERVRCLISQKHDTGHWRVADAHHLGVAQLPGETTPIQKVQFRFHA